jgi:hypothetical protein
MRARRATVEHPFWTLKAWMGATHLKTKTLKQVRTGVLWARATMIQQKTGRPVHFELTEPARETLASWLRRRGGRPGDWLFQSRKWPGAHLSAPQYARLVGRWVALVDLEPRVRHAQPAAHEGRAGLP